MWLFAQVRRCLLAGAILGLLMPQAAMAGPPSSATTIRDVALHKGGTLRGKLLSTQGKPAVGTSVSLASHQKTIATAAVAEDGRFVVSGLRPGVYSISVGDTRSVLRLWSANAAPPAAISELMLVDQGTRVVRGANGGHLPQWDHPILVSGLLLTAGVIGGVIGYNVRDAGPAS